MKKITSSICIALFIFILIIICINKLKWNSSKTNTTISNLNNLDLPSTTIGTLSNIETTTSTSKNIKTETLEEEIEKECIIANKSGDTNKLESLLSKFGNGNYLYFKKLDFINEKVAMSLVKHPQMVLGLLSGTVTMDDKTAKIFANYGGNIITNNFTEAILKKAGYMFINEYTVEEVFLSNDMNKIDSLIAKIRSRDFVYLDGINLNKLESITVEMAEKIASLPNREVQLDGLKSISVDAIKEFNSMTGDGLSLNGITSISDKEAEAFVGHGYKFLSLGGLDTITPETAKILTEVLTGGILYLPGIKTISPEVAREFSKFRGRYGVDLSGLNNISLEAARELAKAGELADFSGMDYRLDLSGLSTISIEVAKELSNCKCYKIYLDGLTSISPEVAKELVKYTGDISLIGLKTISPETSSELSKHNIGKIIVPDNIAKSITGGQVEINKTY